MQESEEPALTKRDEASRPYQPEYRCATCGCWLRSENTGCQCWRCAANSPMRPSDEFQLQRMARKMGRNKGGHFYRQAYIEITEPRQEAQKEEKHVRHS